MMQGLAGPEWFGCSSISSVSVSLHGDWISSKFTALEKCLFHSPLSSLFLISPLNGTRKQRKNGRKRDNLHSSISILEGRKRKEFNLCKRITFRLQQFAFWVIVSWKQVSLLRHFFLLHKSGHVSSIILSQFLSFSSSVVFILLCFPSIPFLFPFLNIFVINWAFKNKPQVKDYKSNLFSIYPKKENNSNLQN